jgi:hypothetical protein
MVNLCVIFSHHSRQTARSSGSLGSLRAPGPSALSLSTHRPRHRDENPVTANPLESALTNRDARKSFRIRFYKNGRVSPTFSRQIRNSPLVTNHSPLLAPFLFKSLRTLPFYVCYKSFICRSYENCRGVGCSSHFGTQLLRSLGLNHLSETSVTIEFLAHFGGRALDPLQRLP